MILFPTNWTDNEHDNKEHGIEMVNYWLYRLKPLLKPTSTKNLCFLAADRVGKEYVYCEKKEGYFLGFSCALSINPHVLLDNLDRDNEAVLKVDCTIR